MSIQHIILHKAKTGESLHCRDNENPINQHAEALNYQLNQLFINSGLCLGQFASSQSEDDKNTRLLGLINQHFQPPEFQDFVAFSKSVAEEFKYQLDNAKGKAKGGHLMICHSQIDQEDFLSVILLHNKSSLMLSEDLSLESIEHIDLDKLHMAARINLTAWLKGNSKKYIAFRIGRSSKEVTDYFSRFVGCHEYIHTKADTLNLVLVVNQFCKLHRFDEKKSFTVRKFVHEYCSERLSTGKLALVEDISQILDTHYNLEKKNSFLQIAQNPPFQLSNEINVHKSSLRKLMRYFGSNADLTINFSSTLLEKSIWYNKDSDTLTIQGIPEGLKIQLSQSTQPDLLEET